MAIPRILHQTARSFDALPPDIRENVEQIKAMNPGWEYRFYDDEAILAYVEHHFGERLLRACRRINPAYGVVLADLIRYLVVYREGGVYLDIKSTMVRPLDAMLAPDDVFLLSQWNNRAGAPYAGWGLYPELLRLWGGELQQWHVIATAGHPFLRRVIQEVLFNLEHYHPAWYGTGPLGVLRLSGPVCYSLAIAPMLANYSHRIVDIEELGFRYTMYETATHHRAGENHYTLCRDPIMRRANGNWSVAADNPAVPR